MNLGTAVFAATMFTSATLSLTAGVMAAQHVAEYPLAPCHHVIMMSAPDMSDGGVLAYCANNQFFAYDQQDGQWYHLTPTDLRGVGNCIPVRDASVDALVTHYERVGDQRAVGLYD